jgi:hypothetical protein
MHHIALHLFILSHTYAFLIDPTEQEPEELQEQALVKDTNPNPEQGKP